MTLEEERIRFWRVTIILNTVALVALVVLGVLIYGVSKEFAKLERVKLATFTYHGVKDKFELIYDDRLGNDRARDSKQREVQMKISFDIELRKAYGITILDALDMQSKEYKDAVSNNLIYEKLGAMGMTQPLKLAVRINSDFGDRINPLGYGEGGPRNGRHGGWDLQAGIGEPIHATLAGKVAYAGWYGGYGRAVILNLSVPDDENYQTVDGHMISVAVKTGDLVTNGQVIGYVGSSGQSTGAHLHHEIRYKKIPISPTLAYFWD